MQKISIKSQKNTEIFVGILFSAVMMAILSFLIGYFVSYFNYKGGGGSFISFNRETSAFFSGIVSAILGGFGGLILGGIIREINSNKIKSVIIGGIVNLLIPIMLIYALDNGGRNVQTNLWIYILGQGAAGGIAGLLISSFFSFISKSAKDKCVE